MILGEATQRFASPGEVLEHHGVKGMKWGITKEDITGGKNAAKLNEVSKKKIAAVLATKNPVNIVIKKAITSTKKPPPTSTFKLAKPGSTDTASAPKRSVLSERQQRRADKFLNRADVANTKISELKLANEGLKGDKSPTKSYNRYANNQAIRALDKNQKQALRDAEATQKGKLTSTQKKLIVGAVGVSAILAAGAVYRGQQSGAFNSYMLLGSARLHGEKLPFDVNEKLSGHMSASELLKQIAKPVNPGYSNPGGKMNCRRSTYAYELRRRGFDVYATTSAAGWGQSESGVINALTPGSGNFYRSMSVSEAVVMTGKSSVASGDKRINPVKKIVLDKLTNESDKAELARTLSNIGLGKDVFAGAPKTISSSKRVLEELGKQPNGARGEVLFKFPGFGHSMAYEVVDGVPHIFDSQKGTLYNSATKMVESKWDGFTAAEITRLDNVNLDLNFLSRWATNVGG